MLTQFTDAINTVQVEVYTILDMVVVVRVETGAWWVSCGVVLMVAGEPV